MQLKQQRACFHRYNRVGDVVRYHYFAYVQKRWFQDQTGVTRMALLLDQEQFPHLVRNLRKFYSSVTSARCPFSTKPSESGGTRPENADPAHGIPLLKIPAPSDPTFTTTRTRPPTLHSLQPTREVPAGNPTLSTLLQLPRQADVGPAVAGCFDEARDIRYEVNIPTIITVGVGRLCR